MFIFYIISLDIVFIRIYFGCEKKINRYICYKICFKKFIVNKWVELFYVDNNNNIF